MIIGDNMSIFTSITKGISKHNDSEEIKNFNQPGENAEEIKPTNVNPPQEFPEDFDPVEHSWEFLTNITESVYENFNDNEQDELIKIGESLLNSGAIYQHVIYNADKGKGKKSNKR